MTSVKLSAELPAVGAYIQVYWPALQSWYSGRVVGYNEATGSAAVKYHIGPVENLYLVVERYRLDTGLVPTLASGFTTYV